MLRLAIVGLTGGIVGKPADMEDRSAPILWGVCAAAATYGLSRVLGGWFGVAPVIALAAAFGLLWWLKSRDDRIRAGGRTFR